jgi:hypothetical protein
VGGDGWLKLWDLRSQQEIVLGRALNSMRRISVTFDGKRLAAVAGEGVVRIYDPAAIHELLQLNCQTYAMNHVQFLPGENILVALGKDGLQIWRAPSWEEIAAAEKRN